jgi:dihydrodipicolinate synthase/N-acetylneuraminate lyase
MSAGAVESGGKRIVLVVGVNAEDTSESLRHAVHVLTRGADEAEVHLVRFGTAVAHRFARRQIEGLCRAIDPRATSHVVVHTPASQELAGVARLARRLRADAIVIEPGSLLSFDGAAGASAELTARSPMVSANDSALA